mgnify:CR=1 FL=1
MLKGSQLIRALGSDRMRLDVGRKRGGGNGWRKNELV